MKNILEEVPPTEDLMREHGVLNRVLIIYDTLLVQLKAGRETNSKVLTEAAIMVRDFVHNYHEKQEEKHIFTIFEKNNSMVEMVTTLKEQHQIGRVITAGIIERAQSKNFNDPVNLKQLAEDMEAFVSVYRAHESREDTELFPLVRTLITAEQFEKLADEFEDSEEELFGKHGFERMVTKVGELETQLGIHELSSYTPKIDKP
jgi:hemerythrin-like domain-containing protein